MAVVQTDVRRFIGDAQRLLVGLRESVRLRPRLDAALRPERLEHAKAMLAWARDFIGKPHPDLGRNGAVCPFVPKVLNTDHFDMVFHDEVDGRDVSVVGNLLLGYAQSFRDKYPDTHKDAHLASVT